MFITQRSTQSFPLKGEGGDLHRPDLEGQMRRETKRDLQSFSVVSKEREEGSEPEEGNPSS